VRGGLECVGARRERDVREKKMNSVLSTQTFVGPSDTNLPRSEIDGYQPISRIGEVVVNCFVDHMEFVELNQAKGDVRSAETLPHYHEWAAALPGMIALQRKLRHNTFRHHIAAETAVPVIVCTARLGSDDDSPIEDWQFAGIVRSKSVPPVDDGNGPSYDEMFTIALGGMAVVLNSSGKHVLSGQYIDWCFHVDVTSRGAHNVASTFSASGKTRRPRRVGIMTRATPGPRTIARALCHAAPGQPLDILIYQG